MITLSICWTAVLIIVAFIAAIAFLSFIMYEWAVYGRIWAKIVGIFILISAFCWAFNGFYVLLAEIYCN